MAGRGAGEDAGGAGMKCCKCPLYSSWNTESDRGESCAFFGDDWGHPLQYEDKDGTIIGCYIMNKGIENFDKYNQREWERCHTDNIDYLLC